jgi:hypothetical protein
MGIMDDAKDAVAVPLSRSTFASSRIGITFNTYILGALIP